MLRVLQRHIHHRNISEYYASRIATDALPVLWVKFFAKIVNLPYVFSPIKRNLSLFQIQNIWYINI